MNSKNFILLLSLLFISSATFSSNIGKVVVSLDTLFSPRTDWEIGIKGVVLNGGEITVKLFEDESNTLLYESSLLTSSTEYGGEGKSYSKEELGSRAIYYPNIWNSLDLKTALFSIGRRNVEDLSVGIHHLFAQRIKMRIEINEINATLSEFKLPGVGIVDRYAGNILFPPFHYCHDLLRMDDPITKIWTKMKSPNMQANTDLIIAAHRGFWGDNLGDGFPENSTGAFEAAKQYTKILETDIMTTQDSVMVISHDYSLSRLSNYPGPLTDYLFNKKASELSNLKLRKRNTQVSEYPYLFFDDVIDILQKENMVLTVDIKDLRARKINGVCTANCEYDPAIYGETAVQKIKGSWMMCMLQCIKIAQRKNALHYLAFKTPYSYNELKEYIPESILSELLFMPVIQPRRKDFLSYVDGWIEQGVDKLVAFETNFLNERDMYLTPIEKDGITYENLLHYVYAKTKLRSGCYPEEAIGQKGTVTRYVDWKMKYTINDRRGDHYWLMSIPYARTMVLTTDRPDIWKRIGDIYQFISE